VASGAGPQRLWLRTLDKTADNRSIGFFASDELYRVDIAGGAPVELAKTPGQPRGGSWNAGGIILFAPNASSPLWRIPALGGDPVPVTRLDRPRQASHRFPQFLPDGNHFLFFVAGDPDVAGIYLGALDGREPKRLLSTDVAGAYLQPDHVIFMRQGT